MGKERFLMPVAVHLFLVKEDKIVLSRRYNTGYEDGNYSVIAGHVDGNEDLKSAMIREAKEEAGIAIYPNDLNIVGAMHRKSGDERVDFFLVASVWQGQLKNMEPNKCDDLSWFEINRLPNNMVPYVKKAIENYMIGMQFDMFGW